VRSPAPLGVLLSKCDVLTSAALYTIRIAPGEDPVVDNNISKKHPINKQQNDKKHKSKPTPEQKAPASDTDLPDICKLEFKVGLIARVWAHPDADKLYCEEIDCGEEGGPRQIASGLRPHYSEEEMLGKKVLVVANLKVRS
jgi:tRNA-binding EMAP/Myf-like protein